MAVKVELLRRTTFGNAGSVVEVEKETLASYGPDVMKKTDKPLTADTVDSAEPETAGFSGISAIESALSEKEAELAEREAELVSKAAELSAKEAELVARELVVATAEAELAAANVPDATETETNSGVTATDTNKTKKS